MKTSNKSNVITGAVLLLLAALFSISLFLQLFNFGVGGPGHDNVFFMLGHILYSVYGFSSLLIPAFLLTTGLSCFATKWTAKRTVRLLTAIIPFYTAVITENICRSILKLQNSSFTVTKLIISIVIGLMLIVIEYLFAGIIADKVNDSYYKITKQPRPAANPTVSPKAQKNKDSDFNDVINDIEELDQLAETSVDAKNESPFDAALSTLNYSNSTPETSVEAEVKAEKEEPTNDSTETSSQSEAPATPNADTTIVEETPASDDTISTEESVEEDTEDNEPVTPATILTQEEYAALIQPVPESVEATEPEEEVDELEWNNLPKKPDVLPPEYDENYNPDAASETVEISTEEFSPEADEPTVDFTTTSEIPSTEEVSPDTFDITNSDDNDPALEFPPKDEIAVEYTDLDENSEIFSQDDDGYSAELDISNDDFITQASQLESELLNDIQNETNDEDSTSFASPSDFSISDEIQFYDEDEENPEASPEEDDFVSFEVEADDEPKIQPFANQPIQPAKPIIRQYKDSVIENPSYPHGIVIHKDDVIPETPAEEPVDEDNKPKYPTRIQLSEDGSENPEETEEPKKELSHLLVSKPNYDQINNRKPVQSAQPEKPVQTAAPSPKPQSSSPENTNLDPDFFDVSVNDDPEVVAQKVQADEQKKSLLKRVQERQEMLRAQNEKREQEKQSQAKHSFSSFASDVFDDMEADIRKNNPQATQLQEEDSDLIKEDEEIYQDDDENFTNHGAVALTKSVKDTSPKLEQELEGPTTSANDLTSDDLSAFFNAQEEQNTPKTQEIQGNLPTNNRATKKGPYVIPSDLLTAYKDDQYWLIDEQTKQASLNLTQTLKEFNIEASIIGIKKGPVVTMFELLPAPGVKLSKIVALQDNIALSLAASSVRIVAPIPGKQAVGIEVPNKNRSIVSFREIIEMPLPEWDKMAVPVILGKDILGKPQLVDLVKTPHMLIAGATGSGKSVCVNSLILSILYKRSYKDVKMILVDPKVVELKLYNNIPHLLTPVITEPKKAFQALQYCLCEMERRYALLDGVGVRDISTYNQRIKERHIATEKLPYIVVIIDEFADLMATTGRELEQVVARLTAMSRAVGIHLVLATQRPSVNVITGLIKANIPTRIAFMVASRTDSNIIIDSVGAEKLLGRGDMLYASAVDPNPIRIQGTYVNDNEVEDVVDYVKQFGSPDYIDDEIFVDDEDDGNENVDLFGNSIDEDPLYDQALEIVVQAGKASASYIQRRLKIGYNRAARLVEEMEERGIVGPANGSKPREIIHIP